MAPKCHKLGNSDISGHHGHGKVAKSDLNSTDAYIATKKLAPKNT